ncbi:MAG: hydrogenase expression/formation protein [Burkholderiaceae bacterium]|nr:hydrogenase expression/formation protein [Burkholderiaceae bacterium]
MSTTPFPIPVIAALGPGSQPEEESPSVLPMPRDMATWQPPSLPEPETFAAHADAVAALRAAHAQLERWLLGEPTEPVELAGLSDADRQLIHQVLGEGEVAAAVDGPDGLQAQESVFAGVWRVLHLQDGVLHRDTIEIGAVPARVRSAARADGAAGEHAEVPTPDDLMNGPAVLAELADAQRRWQPGAPQHVVNMTLLPLTTGDSHWLQARIGEGRVRILSRGYGNCRIVDTWQPRTWRVTYFNAQDLILLDTVEVGDVPEVACAAPDDLADSQRRLGEVLNWVESAT